MQGNSDSQFVPNLIEQKNKILDPKWIKRKKKARLKNQAQKVIGTWSRDESLIYLRFLQEFKHDFQHQHTRRAKKVFNKLSDEIQSRSSEQCRRHFQKLQVRCNSQNIDDIIEFMKQQTKVKKEKLEVEVQKIRTATSQIDQKQCGYLIRQSFMKQCIEIKIFLQPDKLGKW